MSRIIIFILSAVLSLPLFSQSGGNPEQEFKIKLQKISNNNKTIQCDFVQHKKVKNMTQIVQNKGLFYYDNSGLMAMHYTAPKGDKIIMNGERFIIVTSGKKMSVDASSNPMMAQISYMMQACMSGDISKLGKGWSMNVEPIDNGYQVLLKPTVKRIQKYIVSMTMCFRDYDLTLDKLRIDEASGGYTEYTFMDKKMNKKIDRSYFAVE